MAGNYPDAPSWRMAWDRDGSQAYTISADFATVTALTATQMQAINDESGSTASPFWVNTGGYLLVWFPEPRDLDGYFIRVGGGFGGHSWGMEVSTDTTNGVDGTWTSIRTYGGATVEQGGVNPDYRNNIVSTTVLGIRGIRVKVGSQGNSQGVTALHLYGEPIPGANPDRLALWHPTSDQRVPPAYLDWGNAPRSSSQDRTFRVKNLSSTKTANSVRVAQEILTDAGAGNPSVPGQHSLSLDGSTFLAQVNVGSLGPGALSAPVTFRRVTPSNAQLGLWAPRVFAEATSWS